MHRLPYLCIGPRQPNFLHDGKPEETGKIKTEGEKQKYDEANEEKPFIARLIVELGKADLKIISTDHSVKVTLSIIWKLMWWDRDTNVKDEDDAIIRNDLLLHIYVICYEC